MVGTVSTRPESWPAACARPIAACNAITRPLMSGETSLANSTVKAVSPQDRYRTLTSDVASPYERSGPGSVLARRHLPLSPSRGRSVRNMMPGSCVIMNSGRVSSATACGVTPQAQKTGTSPRCIGDGVSVGWSTKIGNAYLFRAADMKRRAVCMRIASRQLANQLDLSIGDRAHRHHGGSVETTGRTTSNIGHEHRDGSIALHVAHADARLDQGVVEGMAATHQESDEVVPPEVADFLALLDQFAVAVDPVAADVGSKVGAWRRARGLRIAGWRDLDEGAGFGIARAESGELRGGLLGKDDQSWPAGRPGSVLTWRRAIRLDGPTRASRQRI